MALSKSQITFLRHAQTTTVYGFNGSVHPKLPMRGAVANTIIKSLHARGLIDQSGMITVKGRGALLNCPEASSEAKVCTTGTWNVVGQGGVK